MTRRARTTRRLSCTWAAAAATVFLAAGCGGDDEPTQADVTTPSTTATQPAQTKASFIREADRACRSAQRKQNNLVKESGGGRKQLMDPANVPPLRKQANIATGLADDLNAFEKPKDDGVRIAAFIDSVRQIGVYSKATSDSIEAKHDSAAAKLAKKLVRWLEVENTLGQSYGFKVCARGKNQY